MATLGRSKVFISYSHLDDRWLKLLRVHLKPLEKEYDIGIWDDRNIESGTLAQGDPEGD